MYRSIMVPLDGSTFGEHALPTAISIARRSGATLHLVHVHSRLEATYAEIQLFDATLDEHLRQREQVYLESVADRVRQAGVAKVEVFNKNGDKAPTLRDHVLGARNDLVVMTTHARGPMGRFWLGSTTDELIRDLPNEPLLLVHPQEHAPDLSQAVHFKNILVALDGTPLAEQILEPVLELGTVMNSEYTLLRVVHPITPMDMPISEGTFGGVLQSMVEQIERIHGELEKEAINYLEGVAQKLRTQGHKVQSQIVLDEQAGLGILHRAQASSVDLIALETHGRRGLARLFLGSVTSKVIRGSTLPILVYRPKH